MNTSEEEKREKEGKQQEEGNDKSDDATTHTHARTQTLAQRTDFNNETKLVLCGASQKTSSWMPE